MRNMLFRLSLMALFTLSLAGCGGGENGWSLSSLTGTPTTGEQGPQGEQGPAGPAGPAGPTGATGAPGTSNNGAVLTSGNTGTGPTFNAAAVPSFKMNAADQQAINVTTTTYAAYACVTPLTLFTLDEIATNGCATTASGGSGEGGVFVEGDHMVVNVNVTDRNGVAIGGDANGASAGSAGVSTLAMYINGPRTNVTVYRTAAPLMRLTQSARGLSGGTNVNLLTTNLGRSYDDTTKTWTYITPTIAAPATNAEWLAGGATGVLPGSYAVNIRAAGLGADADGITRARQFKISDVQIHSATFQPHTADRFKCGACHLGADSGTFYFHHSDNNREWDRDGGVIRTCKNCHNMSGGQNHNVCALNGTGDAAAVGAGLVGIDTTGDMMQRSTDILSGNCPTGYTQVSRARTHVLQVHRLHMGQDRRGAQVNVDGTGNGWKPRNTSVKRGLQNPINVGGTKIYGSADTFNPNSHLAGRAFGQGLQRQKAAVIGFPSDVRNCEKCHADDSYKTKPSRLACGACHDNVNFEYSGSFASFVPAYFRCDDASTAVTAGAGALGRPICTSNATYAGEIPHPGGQQLTDDNCALCHQPSGGLAGIEDVHNKAVPSSGANPRGNKAPKYNSSVVWGKYVDSVWTPVTTSFAVGEQPVMRVTFTNASTSAVVDHTTITRANTTGWTVFMGFNGPRAKKMPVLTSGSRAMVLSKAGPFDLGAGGSLVVEIDGGANDAAGVGSTNGVTATVALTGGSRTAAQVAAELNANTAFAAKAVAYTRDQDSGVAGDAAVLIIRGKSSYAYSGIKVLSGTVGSVLFDSGTDTNPMNDINTQYDLITGAGAGNRTTGMRTYSVSGAYTENQLARQTTAAAGVDVAAANDPKVSYTTDYIEYRMDTIDTSVPAGTYTLTFYQTGDGSNAPRNFDTHTVQIGTTTVEALTADNCKSCHDYDKRWHESNVAINDGVPFSTNNCGSCHDYKQQAGGKVAGGLQKSWLAVTNVSSGGAWGFGAMPHSKRLHGLHFGNYLNKPLETHNGYQISKTIWPQDARNCQKCHAGAGARFTMNNQSNVMGVQRGLRDNEVVGTSGRAAATWLYIQQPMNETGLKAGRAGTAEQVAAGTHDFVVTSGRNLSNPGRIACNGCHDSDAAIGHTATMTNDPTPSNPYSGDEIEACAACHGVGKGFAISTQVMNIANPVQFPYNRAPSWATVTNTLP